MISLENQHDPLIAGKPSNKKECLQGCLHCYSFWHGFILTLIIFLSIFVFFILGLLYFDLDNEDREIRPKVRRDVTLASTTTVATTTNEEERIAYEEKVRRILTDMGILKNDGTDSQTDAANFLPNSIVTSTIVTITSNRYKKIESEDSENATSQIGETIDSVNSTSSEQRIVACHNLLEEEKPTKRQLSQLTHIILYPLEIHSNGMIALGAQQGKIERLVLMAKSFDVKVMFSTVELIRKHTPDVMMDKEKRRSFLNSIIEIIQSNNFDGVDVHWRWSYTYEHQTHLISLFKELREQLTEISTSINRTAAYLISASTGLSYQDPRVAEISDYADFFNIEDDLHYGYGSGGFGEARGPTSEFSSERYKIEKTLKYYSCLLKAPKKLNLVVRFYETMFQPQFTRISLDECDEIESFECTFARNAFSIQSAKKQFGEKLKYLENKNIGGLTIWRMGNDDNDGSLLTMAATRNCSSSCSDNAFKFACH